MRRSPRGSPTEGDLWTRLISFREDEGRPALRPLVLGRCPMSDRTKIEWTDASWNPVVGCTKVSPGCDHCYAERVTERFHGPGSFAKVTLLPDRLDQPLHWRKPRRVFVNSMSDLFHDDVPDGFIAWVLHIIEQCPQHTFQLLTKRHGRMRSFMRRWADRSGDGDHDKESGMPPMPRGPEAIREV